MKLAISVKKAISNDNEIRAEYNMEALSVERWKQASAKLTVERRKQTSKTADMLPVYTTKDYTLRNVC